MEDNAIFMFVSNIVMADDELEVIDYLVEETYIEINKIKRETLDTNIIDKCRACESQVNLYNLFDNPDNLSKKFAMCTSLEVYFRLLIIN